VPRRHPERAHAARAGEEQGKLWQPVAGDDGLSIEQYRAREQARKAEEEQALPAEYARTVRYYELRVLETFPHLGALYGHRLLGMDDGEYAEAIAYVSMRETERARERGGEGQ
jgi:hypothetical protein